MAFTVSPLFHCYKQHWNEHPLNLTISHYSPKDDKNLHLTQLTNTVEIFPLLLESHQSASLTSSRRQKVHSSSFRLRRPVLTGIGYRFHVLQLASWRPVLVLSLSLGSDLLVASKEDLRSAHRRQAWPTWPSGSEALLPPGLFQRPEERLPARPQSSLSFLIGLTSWSGGFLSSHLDPVATALPLFTAPPSPVSSSSAQP